MDHEEGRLAMKRMHLVTMGVGAGGVAVGMLLAGASFRSLLIPLLILACPVMMIFMGGHGGGGAGEKSRHRPRGWSRTANGKSAESDSRVSTDLGTRSSSSPMSGSDSQGLQRTSPGADELRLLAKMTGRQDT